MTSLLSLVWFLFGRELILYALFRWLASTGMKSVFRIVFSGAVFVFLCAIALSWLAEPSEDFLYALFRYCRSTVSAVLAIGILLESRSRYLAWRLKRRKQALRTAAKGYHRPPPRKGLLERVKARFRINKLSKSQVLTVEDSRSQRSQWRWFVKFVAWVRVRRSRPR